jgi:hypothetical protein
MRHTSPRRANVATIAIDDNHQISAWITHDGERKAYIVTAAYEELRRYADGSVIRLCKPYAGDVRSAHVEDAPRFSARRLRELAAAPHVRAYVDAFAAAYLTPSTEA